MKLVQLRTVKKGEPFRRGEHVKTTYIKGDYMRDRWAEYKCHRDDDYYRCIYLKGQAMVYVGFNY